MTGVSERTQVRFSDRRAYRDGFRVCTNEAQALCGERTAEEVDLYRNGRSDPDGSLRKCRSGFKIESDEQELSNEQSEAQRRTKNRDARAFLFAVRETVSYAD